MTKKRRRRKPEQIVRAIQEGEAMLAAGKSEAEVFQALEISSATWDRWKKQFGGIKCDEAKRLYLRSNQQWSVTKDPIVNRRAHPRVHRLGGLSTLHRR